MKLSTEGLLLRPFEDGDALACFETCRAEIARKSGYDIGIFLADGGSFAGGIAINSIDAENKIGNVGYWIRESMQNRGICSRAVERVSEFGFHELELVRLEIIILKDNAPSRRVAEKCGAKLECIAENRLIHNARPMPAAVYSLLRP